MTRRDYPAFSETAGGTAVRVRVNPRSSRDELVDLKGELVRIKLTAPAVEGEANRALIRFLAEEIGVPKSDIEIVSGDRSRRKTVRIRGISVDGVLKALNRDV